MEDVEDRLSQVTDISTVSKPVKSRPVDPDWQLAKMLLRGEPAWSSAKLRVRIRLSSSVDDAQNRPDYDHVKSKLSLYIFDGTDNHGRNLI